MISASSDLPFSFPVYSWFCSLAIVDRYHRPVCPKAVELRTCPEASTQQLRDHATQVVMEQGAPGLDGEV